MYQQIDGSEITNDQIIDFDVPHTREHVELQVCIVLDEHYFGESSLRKSKLE